MDKIINTIAEELNIKPNILKKFRKKKRRNYKVNR